MVVDGLDHPLSQKREVGTNYMTTHQHSYKQGSISFFICNVPKVLNTTIFIFLFGFLGPFCDLRYLKPTILAFLVVPHYHKMVNLDISLLDPKQSVLRTPFPRLGYEYVYHTYLGSYPLVKHVRLWCYISWTIPLSRKFFVYYELLDKTPIQLLTGLYLGFLKPWFSKC